jgi:hypothetical protein
MLVWNITRSDSRRNELPPSVSLGALQLAVVFLDLIVFVDQLAGIERARVTPGLDAI